MSPVLKFSENNLQGSTPFPTAFSSLTSNKQPLFQHFLWTSLASPMPRTWIPPKIILPIFLFAVELPAF
jgi:hypothetical protein